MPSGHHKSARGSVETTMGGEHVAGLRVVLDIAENGADRPPICFVSRREVRAGEALLIGTWEILPADIAVKAVRFWIFRDDSEQAPDALRP